VWLGTNLLIYYSFARWIFRRQWRLFQNLKRPVVILQPQQPTGDVMPGGKLDVEIGMIRENGFLNVANQPTDHRSFNPVGKHCVVVLGYRPGMVGLGDILSRIKSNHVPLIVYTYGEVISGPDKETLGSYPSALYANFPITLLNHIFATVASYPYERK
jgi:hypothetical protein